MIDAMKANLFGVMVHPIIPQCIVTGSQENQIIAVVKTVWSCIENFGMIMAAKRSLAMSVKNPKVIFVFTHSVAYWT